MFCSQNIVRRIQSHYLFICYAPVHTVEVEGTFDRVKWAYTLARKWNSTHLTKSKEHSWQQKNRTCRTTT